MQSENLPCPLDVDPFGFSRDSPNGSRSVALPEGLRAAGHQPAALSGCSDSIRARMHRRITEFWLASVGAASFSIHCLTSRGTRKRTDLVSSLRDMIRPILVLLYPD